MSVEAVITEATKRITPELLMGLQRATEAVVSSDGTKIAFSVLESFTQPDKPSQGRIWTANVDGVSTQATRGPGTDAAPRWSPE